VAQKSVNTGTALGAGLIGSANVARESLFGTDQSYRNAVSATTSTVDEFLRSGVGNKGAYLNPEQSKTSGDGLQGFKKNIAAPIAQGVADIAPLVLPVGAIGQTGKLAGRAGKQALANAVVGGTTDAAQQQLATGKVDLGQTLKATAVSGAIGGAFPLAGAGIKIGAKGTVAVGKDIKNLPEDGFIAGPMALDFKKAQVTQNSLTRKVDQQNLSPEVQAKVQGEDAVRNTQALQERAIAQADSQPLQKTIEDARESLNVKAGSIDDDVVANAQQAIERADADGRVQDAVDLHDALSEQLRAQGRSIQAASLFYNLSPDGMFYRTVRDVKKGGGKYTPELEAKLRAKADEIKTITDPDAKKYAQAELAKLASDNLPRKASQDLLSIWKAGLLSGVKTQTGNSASGLTFGALRTVSNPIAAGVDKLASFATGERTKTASLKGLGSGGIQGAKSGVKTLKTGIDVRNIIGDKYEQFGEMNFKNPVLNKVLAKPTNFVFRSMSAGDQPYYYAALKNTTYDLAKADGLNKGLKGQALKDHMQKTVNDPPVGLAEKAVSAAEKAVLGQDNKLASKITSITRDFPAAGVLVPFVKVPTNFLIRSLDYTPVGAIKTVVSQIKNKQFDQRAFSEAIGEATTGTALIYLGAELANSDLLSGQYPKNDSEEAQRWKAEGITPNSVKIGGKWVSLNYLGPLGLILGAGKDYQEASQKGDNATLAALAGAGKTLTGQSFLSGFSGFTNAVNDPQRSAGNFVKSQAGSVVPSISNDVANLFDKNQRDADNVVDAAKSRLPGARNTLPVKQTVYGKELDQATDPANKLANPGKPSKARTDDVLGEVARLKKSDINNKDLAVTPTPVGKAVGFGGKDDKDKAIQTKLNPDQRRALQKQVGEATQRGWSELIKTPEYQALSDVDKANALNNSRTKIAKIAQQQYAQSNNIAIGKPEKAKDILSFAKSRGSSKSSDTAKEYNTNPGAEYQDLKTKYDEDKKDGNLTRVQDIKRSKELKKAEVGSKYSKDIRDLYSLSKADVASVIATDPNGKQLADQLLAYGDDLKNSGNETYNKFRSRNGTASFSAAKSTGGRKSSGRRSAGRGSRAGKSSKGTIPKGSFTNIAAVRQASNINRKLAFSGKIKKTSFSSKFKNANVKLSSFKPKTATIKTKKASFA
jgi:hypothetical protein